MSDRPDASSATNVEPTVEQTPTGIDSDGQLLLDEIRTTSIQQLGQIDKVDDIAVRTVKITFVLLGIFAGGTRFGSVPDLGLLGVLGTASLGGSLVSALLVFGTTRLFIGPRLDDMSLDYAEPPRDEDAYAEVIDQYEKGMARNRRLLYSNTFVLHVSRTLLAVAVVLLVLGISLQFGTVPLEASPPSEHLLRNPQVV